MILFRSECLWNKKINHDGRNAGAIIEVRTKEKSFRCKRYFQSSDIVTIGDACHVACSKVR